MSKLYQEENRRSHPIYWILLWEVCPQHSSSCCHGRAQDY
jgi:hypothetical protein